MPLLMCLIKHLAIIIAVFTKGAQTGARNSAAQPITQSDITNRSLGTLICGANTSDVNLERLWGEVHKIMME
jgi:hypothetical protein